MGTLDLASRKLKLIEKFMSIVDEKKIEQLEFFFEKDKQDFSFDFWDELPASIQKIIEQSLLESKRDKISPFETIVAETKSRYNLE